MPDSIRVKEIHQALQANKFAYGDTNTERIANLGYYIERIARVLGISVNPDGTVRSVRQKKVIKKGNSIPAGWEFGQWGLNTGGNTEGQLGGEADEYRDGIIYEQRSNQLESNLFNPEEYQIVQGDYTLCENIPQLLDEILDDLDKALGWQELGANALPNADGSGKFCIYEGLAQLLTEVAYVGSRISQHTAQTQIATLIVQAVCYELLKATGQPLKPKTFQIDVSEAELASVPYPGLDVDAPSAIEQTGWILQTLAPILAAIVKAKPTEPLLEEPDE